MAKAFGKVILAGEHAVVYGYPAIASVIGQSVRVEASYTNTPGFEFENHHLNARGDAEQLLEQLSPKLQSLLGERISKVQFKITSQIPGGCGLGSSAALSVALIRSALDLFGEQKNTQEVTDMALEIEKIFHGNPSGIDHTVIAEESLIWFQENKAKHIQCPKPFNIVIAITGPHAGTLKAVQAVRARYENNPQATKHTLEAIADITHNMREAIQTGDIKSVATLMTENHKLLGALGVSTPELDSLCKLAIDNGALGAKLTGAGGGGSIIALTHEPNRLAAVFKQAGYQALQTVVG
ncbi:MAG: mevalonate kinase [Deltaproteobacteria bacterium]|nr:mevalonate kinase [Deltaproteobacteria bacterium]